ANEILPILTAEQIGDHCTDHGCSLFGDALTRFVWTSFIVLHLELSFRSITSTATQLCPNRVHSAKGKRRDCRGWIRSRTGRKDAAAKNEKILVIVRSAILVDHRVGLVAHARCPHDVTRAAERERLGVIIEL